RLSPQQKNNSADRLLKMIKSEPLQQLIAEELLRYKDHPKPDKFAIFLLDVMARSGLKKYPPSWTSSLTQTCANDPDAVDDILRVYRSIPIDTDTWKSMNQGDWHQQFWRKSSPYSRLLFLACAPFGHNDIGEGSSGFDWILKSLVASDST